jgi:hypothetical protein
LDYALDSDGGPDVAGPDVAGHQASVPRFPRPRRSRGW